MKKKIILRAIRQMKNRIKIELHNQVMKVILKRVVKIRVNQTLQTRFHISKRIRKGRMVQVILTQQLIKRIGKALLSKVVRALSFNRNVYCRKSN